MKATHFVDENSEALGGEETPQRHTAAEPKSDLPVTNESFFCTVLHPLTVLLMTTCSYLLSKSLCLYLATFGCQLFLQSCFLLTTLQFGISGKQMVFPSKHLH